MNFEGYFSKNHKTINPLLNILYTIYLRIGYFYLILFQINNKITLIKKIQV